MKKIKQEQFRLKIFASLFWVLGIILCGLPTSLYAGNSSPNLEFQQTKTITGKIISDDDALGLPGVTVIVKGTTTGTSTDFDGNYSIKVPSNDAVLVFSYLGYTSQEVTVGTKTTINITLKPDATTLDEIVVVGYGAQKKLVVTGSIDVVKAEVFEDRAISNPVLALQGATPGLVVSRSSSRPGEEGAGFLIRGNTSINGGSALIVVDGVPGADFARINPDDIESISVLKDASASVYGARAANGVILVTTKKGKGKMSIDVNSQIRINTLGIEPQNTSALNYFKVYADAMQSDEDVLGTAQYNAFGWLSLDNINSIVDMLAAGEEGYVNSFWGTPAGNPTDLYITDNNIWKQLYGTSISNQQNISISGSTDKIDYRFSGMYEEQVGPLQVAYDGEVQYNIRSVVNAQISDRFKLGTNISLNHSKLSQPAVSLSGSNYSSDPSIYPTVNPFGQWVSNFNYSGGGRAPVADIVDGGRNFEERDRFNITLDATYKITEHLDFKASAAFLINNLSQTTYRLAIPIYSFDGLAQVNTLNNTGTRFYTQFGTGRKDVYGAYFNYKNTFKEDHNVTVTAGVNTEDSSNKTLWANRVGFEDQGVYNITSASEDLQTNGGRDTHEGLYGILGNVTYDYQNKYLVNATFRRDGSSRFAPEERWDNFLSGSLGWVLTKEKFMEDVEFLSFLKLRTSYGESANGLTGIGLYDYISQIDNGTILFGETPSLQTTAYLAGLTSRERSWERVQQKNIGIDFSMFDSRLSGTFDYFEKQNLGMFIAVDYPFVLGDPAPLTNNGDLKTKGWEVSLNWKDNINKDFKYNVGFFISDAKDEIINRGGFEQPIAGVTNAVEGYPLQSLWVYQTDGIFQTQAEVDEYYNTYDVILNNDGTPMAATGVATTLSPGDIKKVDVNKDGRIDQTDLVYVGDTRTHFNFGINLSAQYKGFDFGALFQGVGKQNIMRTGRYAYPIVGRFSDQTDQFLGQTWSPTNTDASLPRTTTHTNRSSWNWAFNDFRVQDNSYIRLKTLTIGYTLPEFKLNNLNINKIRVYFSGNDLWEATNLDDGYDPEYGSDSSNTHPYTRTWAFGININI